MKRKYILINILPLLLWLVYYIATLSKDKELFMIPNDDYVWLILFIVFTIYNLFSVKVTEFLLRNLVNVASLTAGCYIGGRIYLEFCYTMSDTYYAVKSISLDLALCGVLFTVGACLLSFIIVKIRKRKA